MFEEQICVVWMNFWILETLIGDDKGKVVLAKGMLVDNWTKIYYKGIDWEHVKQRQHQVKCHKVGLNKISLRRKMQPGITDKLRRRAVQLGDSGLWL